MFSSVLAAIALAFSGAPQSTQTPEETAMYAADYRDLAAAYATAPKPVIVSVEVDRRRDVVRVTGTAPAIWFSENQFPIALEDAKGDGIGDFLAHAPHNFGDDENESWAFAVNISIKPGATPATVIVSADEVAGEWGDVGPPPTPTFRFAIPAETR
ncbi:hypothetical protein [Brevundimonas sp.]|uniref:hypothetical protein n=1 Tax=Brevundimonas sp. TaxID=1871086 RepID=UPI001A32B2F2|nr:hypothetical protein [Brevundimonas sp.]MBJ7485633.1 hypothetical protein [Brevundimonas sp.]